MLEIKLIAAAAAFFSLVGLALWVPAHYRNQGIAQEQAAQVVRDAKTITQTIADNAKLKKQQDDISRKNSEEHANEIKKLTDSYLHDIAVIRLNGGLRVPKVACLRPAAEANTASNAGDYEASTTRLPEQIESDLFNYAKERDEEIIQLQSCQKWIRANGFYK